MVIVASIFTIIGTLGFFAFTIRAAFDKPALTYEDNSYPVNTQSRLVHIAVRNEGQRSAEEVVIDITVDGEIGNIWTRKGRIVGEIEEVELFQDQAVIRRNKSWCKVEVRYIAEEIKYEVGLLVKPKGDKASYKLLITSKNGGVAEKYVKKGPGSLVKGFIAGAIFGVAAVFLVLGVRWFRRKGEEARRSKV